ADLPHFREDFVADRRAGLYDGAAGAVRARICQRSFETLLHALPCDDNQSEIRHLERLRRRSILPQLLLNGLEDLLTILLVLHVDCVDDDDAAEIAQASLTHDFLHGFEVGLENSVFEAARSLLSDVAAGVHVDGHERLGLVDDDRAAGLQPHLAAQRLVDLSLNAILLEDWKLLGV